MRKDLVFIRVVRVVLAIGIILGVLFFLSYNEHHYVRTGFCKQVGNGDYYFYDTTGNVWYFYADEKIPSDAMVEVYMFSNCTLDDISDDIITGYQVLKSELKIEVEKDSDF